MPVKAGSDSRKTALICGISGQDGAYLARHLVAKGYSVFGTSRDAERTTTRNLELLSVREAVQLRSMTLNDFRSVLEVLSRTTPDEIYNLAGQTSVGLSFEQPVDTLESIATGTINLLEATRYIGAPFKLYNACSSECFGDTDGRAADEKTPFRPRSPYAVAKAAAFWAVANYREAYGLFAASGILFNHESPLRPERFVTRKIIESARRIGSGSSEVLHLGNVDVRRDWGWAPEYVEAMWLMLQAETASDYVIATGESHSIREFCVAAFGHFGIEVDWRGAAGFDVRTGRLIIETDPALMRPLEVMMLVGDASKAGRDLGWVARTRFAGLISKIAGSPE